MCTGNYELLFPSFDPVVLLPPGYLVWSPDHPTVEQGPERTVQDNKSGINSLNPNSPMTMFKDYSLLCAAFCVYMFSGNVVGSEILGFSL